MTAERRDQSPRLRSGHAYGLFWLAAFMATIPAANYSIQNVGWCSDFGPCTIPVMPAFPGLWGVVWAPSGVLWIGLAFLLRDFVHESYGWRGAMLAILVGAALSWFIAPAFAIASGVAFLVSETADLVVYSPLRRRNLVVAVYASNAVGLVVDSILFLWLAFASLQFIEGQIIGKLLMSTAGAAALVAVRRWIKPDYALA